MTNREDLYEALSGMPNTLENEITEDTSLLELAGRKGVGLNELLDMVCIKTQKTIGNSRDGATKVIDIKLTEVC